MKSLVVENNQRIITKTEELRKACRSSDGNLSAASATSCHITLHFELFKKMFVMFDKIQTIQKDKEKKGTIIQPNSQTSSSLAQSSHGYQCPASPS